MASGGPSSTSHSRIFLRDYETRQNPAIFEAYPSSTGQVSSSNTPSNVNLNWTVVRSSTICPVSAFTASNAATNTYTVTLKGFYNFRWTPRISTTQAGIYQAQLLVNGTIVHQDRRTSSAAITGSLYCDANVACAVGDVITMQVLCTNTGLISNTMTVLSAPECKFQVHMYYAIT